MKIGYARVSTIEQNLDLQLDALTNAGCEKIFHDRISGAKSQRSGLQQALDYMRPGDTLVVWRLDRLGRSLSHLITLITQLEEQQVAFCTLQESIDTTTTSGQLIFHLFAVLAEFERNLIQERTESGLAAAKARGRQGGRPKSLDDKQVQLLIDLHHANTHSVQELCDLFSISRSTLYTYLSQHKQVNR